MVICPGIGNHSEQKYVRTFVDHAQRRGYRCAVLNHLGALPGVELTSPRVFTYGKAIRAEVKASLKPRPLPPRLHLGVCGDGGGGEAGAAPHEAGGGGLQPRGQRRLQVPGGEAGEPGARGLLRQRLPGLQRPQVGVGGGVKGQGSKVAVCRAQETFLQWDRCRRLYNFILADNMKMLLLSHR